MQHYITYIYRDMELLFSSKAFLSLKRETKVHGYIRMYPEYSLLIFT